MLHQSFRQVFVTNSPALLASGATVENLAVGQIGIVDAKTYKGTSSPTYANNKAIKFVWGTPDLSDLPMMSGTFNGNEYSKLVKGKLITDFRGKKARRGQNQIITVGFSGDVVDTDTLFALPGERKHLNITLTGDAITKLYSPQGITRFYTVEAGCVDECTDTCQAVDCRFIAEDLAKQINNDEKINRFVKASVTTLCDPAITQTTVNCYRFEVSLCDTRDEIALGIVQAQYPNSKVERVRTSGANSVYSVILDANSAPAAVSNAGLIMIPDCPVCPSGYTLSDNKFAYKVTRSDAGSGANLTTINTDYAIASPETSARIVYQYGQSTYILLSDVKISAAVGADNLVYLGETRNTCVLTSPSTFSWSLAETLVKYTKTFRVTVADSICGTNRLAEIQAAFPNNVVTIVNASGACVHTYETTVYSQCVPQGCSLDVLKFTKPQPFLGSHWTEVPASNLNEAQSIVATGATAGDFTLTFAGSTTEAIPYNATAVQVASALDGLDNLTSDDVTVTGGPLPATPVRISFKGDRAGDNVATITADSTGLTGGSGVVVTVNQQGTSCRCGVRIETVFNNRIPNEETYQYFNYESDGIHITASQFDPDYNHAPEKCEDYWVVKQIQAYEHPAGVGAYVRKLEEDSKGYDLRNRAWSPVVRQLEKYQFQAKDDAYYDEYAIEYSFKYKVGGWSDEITDHYTQFFYFPEGQGKAFEAAINAYISSVGIDLDPVIL